MPIAKCFCELGQKKFMLIHSGKKDHVVEFNKRKAA
jgi:hypothetical protein